MDAEELLLRQFHQGRFYAASGAMETKYPAVFNGLGRELALPFSREISQRRNLRTTFLIAPFSGAANPNYF
jgi:hypothetical protein